MSTVTKIKDYINKDGYKYECPYLTTDDYNNILEALEIKELNSNCIGMSCTRCGSGVHKYLYLGNNRSCLIEYCPFCGNKLNWE